MTAISDLQSTIAGVAERVGPSVVGLGRGWSAGSGVVVAAPYQDRPPRFEYELSAAARELAGPLRLLADWGARHRDAQMPRHEVCGTPLEARLYCPACEVAVEADLDDETVEL